MLPVWGSLPFRKWAFIVMWSMNTLWHCDKMHGRNEYILTWWLPMLTGVSSLFALVVATTLSFDGTQYMRITMPEESRTEAEDVSLRFKTRRSNGLLFATTSTKTSDRLEVMIEGGRVRVDVNLGSGSKVCSFYVCLPSPDSWMYLNSSKSLLRVHNSAVKPYLCTTDCFHPLTLIYLHFIPLVKHIKSKVTCKIYEN